MAGGTTTRAASGPTLSRQDRLTASPGDPNLAMVVVTPPPPPPLPQHTPSSFACYSNTARALAAAATCGSLSATPTEIVHGQGGLKATAEGDHDHGQAKANHWHSRRQPPTATSTPAPVPLSNSHSRAATTKTSTFNAKFRVHSRHRSIGKLEELHHHKEPAVELMLIEPPSIHSSSSSPLNQSSVVARLAELREKKEVADEHEIITRKSFQEKKQQQAVKEAMSQTIQSIHSLSMQLNRAASMQDQLDEICHLAGPQTLNLHHQQQHHQQQQAGEEHGGARGDITLAGSKLSRLVTKKAARVKEMLLQNLGKSDRTRDEIFQMYEENFYKQQAHALKLQKEFRSYVSTLGNFQVASRSLNSCIQQSTGHYQSARHDLVCENLSQLEHLNEDLLDKLRGQVLVSLQEYLAQFNELRDKIAKRRRKLIDYDSSRRIYELMLANVNKKRLTIQQGGQNNNNQVLGAGRSLRSAFMLGVGGNGGQVQGSSDNRQESLQTATCQLMDEARLLKLREQFNYCKVMYETINSELHEELPMVYEKKMKNLLMTLQNYFSLEAQFHSNSGKLFATASDVIDELPMSIRQQQHHQQRHHNHHHNHHHHQATNNSSSTDVYDAPDGVSTSKGLNDGSSAGKGAIACGGSSGMGSSRGGDSSLDESSSSSSASIDGDKTPLGEAMLSEEAKDIDQEEEELAAKKLVGDGINEHLAVKQAEEDEEEVVEFVSQEVGEAKCLDNFSESVIIEDEGGALKVVDEISGNDAVNFEEVPLAVELNPNEMKVDEDKNGTGKEVEMEVRDETVSSAGETEPPITTTTGDFLYKVKTSYKYLAEDVDELCFEADEIIQVVQFDESQEQEEGWLLGIREVNGQRGLFPANFTRPI